MRLGLGKLALACALVVVAPSGARAQGNEIGSLFKALDAVGGFWSYTGFLPHSSTLSGGKQGSPTTQSGVQGPGFAFMFHLNDARDSVVAFHVALAYSRLSDFHSQDPSFDLRGSLVEVPRFALLVQFRPRRRFSSYVGLHMGIAQLQSTAIYDSNGTYYPIGGSTYEVGAAVGESLNLHVAQEYFNIFVEPAYSLRNVVNLDWNGGAKIIPARFPRSLRFTGWEIAMGMTFAVPKSGGSSGKP